MPEQNISKAVIVIVGQQFGNQTFHGPFSDSDELNQWVSTKIGNQPYVVVPLLNPYN